MTASLPPLRWFVGGTLCGAVLVWTLTRPTPAFTETPPVSPVASTVPASTSLASVWRPEAGMPPAEITARIASWLALDPAASPFAERALGLRALLLVADAGQLASLADRLARRGGPDDPRWFTSVFTRWTELDPAAGTSWTSTLGAANRLPAEDWAKTREQGAFAWAKSTFDPAYAWAIAEPDADHPDGVAARLLGWLAGTDPARALALAETRGSAFAAAALRPIFDTWAKRDPEAALRALGPRLLAAKINHYELVDSLAGWLQKSPDAAIAWMGDQPLLAAWRGEGFASSLSGHTDRLSIVAAVLRVTDSEVKYPMLRQMLVYGWPGAPEQAAALLDKIEDPDLRARLLRDSLRINTPSRPERHLPIALLLPPGGERDKRLIQLTSDWARRDPLAALAWLKTHDEPALAAAVQAATLGAIARDEPATAVATWATLPAGPIRDRAVDEIARGWTAQDPAAAAKWLAEQYALRDPKLEFEHQTLEPLMSAWAAKDADAALAWAEARQTSAANDFSPLYVWADQIAKQLPAAKAADQIGRIREPNTRRQALYSHAHRWLDADPAAAEAWLTKQTHVAPDVAQAWIAEARRKRTR